MKIKILGLLSFFIAAVAFASTNLNELNAEVERVLARFQDKDTVAQFIFDQVETNEEHALALKLHGLYQKIGSQTTLAINAKNISYEYGDGTKPTSKANIDISLDILKIFPQDQVNAFVPDLEDMLKEMANDYAKDFGDAAKVNIRITDKQQDQDGNYTSIAAVLQAKLDLDKLPEGIKVEDQIFTELDMSVSVDLHTGILADVTVISNPAYKGFQKRERGLKEILDALLAREENQIREIEYFFQSLDSYARRLVDGNL